MICTDSVFTGCSMLKILLGIILMQSVSYLDWMNVKKRVNWHTNWKDEDEKMIVSCLCVNLRAVLCRFLISISQWCHKNKHATLKQTTEFLYPWFNANTRCGLIKSVCKQTHKHSPAGSQTARVIKMHSRFNTHTHSGSTNCPHPQCVSNVWMTSLPWGYIKSSQAVWLSIQ